ncbi:MAG: WG repeat-containing protein, partial [candidate division WOR-3 bacterium]
VVVPIEYDMVLDFSEGRAAVKKDREWSYIDKNNKTVLTTEYEDVGSFHEGLAKFKDSDEKYGFINTKGEVVIEAQFDHVDDFSEGLAGFWNEEWNDELYDYEYLYGYINTKGEVVIEPNYEIAYKFKHGIAKVEVDGKIGYIDKNGKYIWPPSE